MTAYPLAELPDQAALRVVPCHPPLPAEAAAAVVSAVGKLLQQFVREGRLAAFAVEVQAGGGLLLIASVEQGEGWSGCRKDKLAKVLADHEQRTGHKLLAPPPIVIDQAGIAVCTSMGAFRSQVAVGAMTPSTLIWDHLCADLGAWRQAMPKPAAEVPWLAQAMSRMPSAS